jgi:hypothetical protein
VGRWGRQVRGPLLLGCVVSGVFYSCKYVCVSLFAKENGFSPDCLGDPRVVPDSSPRASAVISVRIPQRLMLADGTFFPPGCRAVPWGCASTPAGVAPEALQECGCYCKVFSQSLPVCKVLVSVGVDNISAGLSGAMRTYLAYVCVQCIARRCSCASSPRAPS